MKNNLSNPFTLTVLFLLGYFSFHLLSKQIIGYLYDIGYTSIDTEHTVKLFFNLFYALVAYLFIKKYELLELAGLGKAKLKKPLFFIFPLYLAALNFLNIFEIPFDNISTKSILILAVFCLSIGYAEEYIMRGFIQSLFLKHYGLTKKGIVLSVVGTSCIFGLMHLIKFDNGLWGEISQVIFATFIGTMFGAILLRTRKIWPLVIIHGLVDFFGEIDSLSPIQKIIEEPSAEAQVINSLVGVLVVLPCFIYGLVLLRKVNPESLLLSSEH